MKKTTLFFCCISLIAFLTGCNALDEKRAENLIEDYYNAIIDEDYEVAFDQLYVYDDDYLEEKTRLSTEEAENNFLKKMDFLKEQDYHLSSFKVTEVEYEDGHSFWHHVKIVGEQNQKPFEWNEVAIMYDGKLVVHSDDPFVRYRNGKMNVELTP